MCPWVHGSTAAGQDPGPWWEPRASNIVGAPGAQGCVSRTLAEIRRTPLSKSITTPRTLPSAHLGSVAPPGSPGVPGPPQVPACVPISGSVPARAAATSLAPTPPAPKSLVLVQSHWLLSPREQDHMDRQITREGADGCPQCLLHTCVPAHSCSLRPPQAVEQRARGTPCPVSLIPRVLTPPVASCPPRPHGSPALAPPSPGTHPQPCGPAAPGPVSGYPLTARSKELGWAPGPPGSSRGSRPAAGKGGQGKPSGAAVQGAVPSKGGAAEGLSPWAKRACRRDIESRNQTFTPPRETLPKGKQCAARGLQGFSDVKPCPLVPEKDGVEANEHVPLHCVSETPFSRGMMGIQCPDLCTLLVLPALCLHRER